MAEKVIAELARPGAPMLLLGEVRAFKYSDDPRYWILSDKDYAATRMNARIEELKHQEEGMDTPESTPTQPVQGPPAPPRPKGFQIGRNIHWVNPYDGKHLAGLVAEVVDREAGIANLAVFAFPSRSVWWEEGCVYDPTGVARGSWHYLEPVE